MRYTIIIPTSNLFFMFYLYPLLIKNPSLSVDEIEILIWTWGSWEIKIDIILVSGYTAKNESVYRGVN